MSSAYNDGTGYSFDQQEADARDDAEEVRVDDLILALKDIAELADIVAFDEIAQLADCPLSSTYTARMVRIFNIVHTALAKAKGNL